MELTEIRITLGSPEELPLCGYCSVTFDHCFVVHDLRILKQNDRLFVAMPSRKRMLPCPVCHQKNAIQSRYCNNCGRGLKAGASNPNEAGGRMYNDIAHPVNSEFREQLEQAILREYREAIVEVSREKSDQSHSRSHHANAAKSHTERTQGNSTKPASLPARGNETNQARTSSGKASDPQALESNQPENTVIPPAPHFCKPAEQSALDAARENLHQ